MDKADWKSAFEWGFVVWLVPFAISFVFFDGGSTLILDRLIFKNIMFSILAVVSGIAALGFFGDAKGGFAQAGIYAGALWVGMSVFFDFLTLVGIFGMSLSRYFAEIAAGYLVIFVVPAVVGRMMDQKKMK